MKQNFENAKIYKIINDVNNEIYIGSTCNTLIKRFSSHKSDSKKEKFINRPLYKLINEIGFERFRIELIEDYPCENKYQLSQREGKYIKEIGTLNYNIPGRTVSEYYKVYRQLHIEKLSEKNKVYHQSHKEELKEKKKMYIENNKEHYDSKQKQYYEARKKKTFTCECGCVVQRLSEHRKSEIHKSNMDKLK